MDLKSWPTLALLRLQLQNMEGASSAIKKLESDFDSVFGPHELESDSQLGPAMSNQLHVSKECTDQDCTDPLRKRQDLGPRGKALRFSGQWSVLINDFESGACSLVAGRRPFRNMFRKGLSAQIHFHMSLTSPFHIEKVIFLRAIQHQTSD